MKPLPCFRNDGNYSFCWQLFCCLFRCWKRSGFFFLLCVIGLNLSSFQNAHLTIFKGYLWMFYLLLKSKLCMNRINNWMFQLLVQWVFCRQQVLIKIFLSLVPVLTLLSLSTCSSQGSVCGFPLKKCEFLHVLWMRNSGCLGVLGKHGDLVWERVCVQKLCKSLDTCSSALTLYKHLAWRN